MHTTIRMSALFILLAAASSIASEPPGNLLRNADFQDDWITLLPETKNHHWCYSNDFYNRRDHNPDGWTCRGSWRWLDPDAPGKPRRMVLAPGAEISQRVNVVAVHDDRTREGFPDAGGFPALKPQRSLRPLRVVRDLTLRVFINGDKVPAGAGGLELALCPPGQITASDPMGSSVPATATASSPFPAGTYDGRWVQAALKAADWLKAAQRGGGPGTPLPGCAQVALRYKASTGSVTVLRAELAEAENDAPNLLRNAGFEHAGPDGYPVGWSAPRKYRYFPPGLYYVFNTWHNGESANRGPVEPDPLVAHGGGRSLKMIVASGGEQAVVSDPLVLNQSEARLIEVQAWIKTDRVCMMQIDAVDDHGRRLDGFNFIHKAPVSIGTDDWRLVRQVFRPREPVRSFRLWLCARGVNGYTLDDTGSQPQNNVVGTIWWDDIRVTEPESTADELAARGVTPASADSTSPVLRLERLELGERLFGSNTMRGMLFNPGPERSVRVRWEFTTPSGRHSAFASSPIQIPTGDRREFQLAYELDETCPIAYTECRGLLSVLDNAEKVLASTPLWFATWSTPITVDLGALYLRPDQHQFVRLNLGVSSARLATLSKLQLEVVRRGSGEVLKGWEIRDLPAFVAAMKERIPTELRGDFLNLILARFDASFLPLQPFDDPQRNWFLRASAIDQAGRVVSRADSASFCRLAHDGRQPPIRSVAIRDDLLLLNTRPWVPWGAAYGHIPVYPGPEGSQPVTFRDLHNLPEWNLYDRFTADTYTRRVNDLNCMRYVAASITDRALLEKRWKEDNLYAATAFVVPAPVFSEAELARGAGGQSKLEASLAFLRDAPMVASVAPGIEEVFGLFQGAGAERLKGLSQVVDRLRQTTGKPVMVGHGGYWNRFEFEKVPYFDIYDPETEPLAPADLHTDLRPLVQGRNKVVWLRPQMYEDVPYERWRFHVYVELMRGCRGWQIAHGPGDASLFRGLHGELEHLLPAMASTHPGPDIVVEPWLEHWSQRHGNKVTIIAATTRGIPFGSWTESREHASKAGQISRRTGGSVQAAGDDRQAFDELHVHGVQSLPDPRRWPTGSTLRQWVWLDPKSTPRNLMLLVKADGRWTHAAAWGQARSLAFRENQALAYWFLKHFYRQADGFLGWDQALVPTALEYVPPAVKGDALPTSGRWTRLEIPLDRIGAHDQLLDGVGFLHEGGSVLWGRTSLVDPAGRERVVWGDSIALPQEALAQVRFRVAGLKRGALVRVLFEDRALTAEEGSFVDDFRGQDLYQRYGGEHSGYGSSPVAFHVYEFDIP